ncbi:hypothetical protein [Flavobacterium cellulosilyticum]|uniref:Outer membrane lipoprotein-sorting protein n=1 Tax=Flavobacterium cellulosilyticum TaxID=2541731 RepID=A0A4R5CED1_9FLAO|nr:hypothetical protein [Flavobacterium cellulosilyticum]TDD95542.1 hypothetical protein E0F76_13840 [Flavobacterium cellulosilyticum]
MKKILITVLISTLAFVGCKSTNEKEGFAEKIELAHQKQHFLSNEAIKFNIILAFGGKERLNAKMTLLTNSSKGVLEFKNGAKIIFNKDKVFYSSTIPNEKSVRFDAYTWEYFFLFPFKLSDPGTKWNTYDNKEENHNDYLTQKLTFESGTGDAPDDWYVVYANKSDNLIEKAAYIVTVNGNKEEAEKNPHAIQYLDYKNINGVPIATKWLFWEWKEGKGLMKQIGNATLSDIQFISVDEDTFTPDADFKSIS